MPPAILPWTGRDSGKTFGRYFFWTEGPAISRRDLNVGTAGPQREEFKVFLNNLFEKESAMRNKRLERE